MCCIRLKSYPAGKTTVYTYSKDFADERLNHNLLTITDAKGQHYLTNVYTASGNSNDFCFDRIARQYWGDQDPQAGDIMDFVYTTLAPSPTNGNAVSETVVNDRMGNVTATFFDRNNREVLRREYTGRWNPDVPTLPTDLSTPATPKLRSDDPDYFETKREYNSDSLLTRITHPNGNQTVNIYDDANAFRQSQGNLIERHQIPGPLGGDQPEIVESFEYDNGFGGCCGSNFVTKHVDGRGNATLYQYDENGNRTHITHRIPSIVEDFEYNQFGQMTAHVLPDNGSNHRRRDENHYYASGAQNGYRKETVVDAGGFNLTTAYQYDAVGNVTTVVDPRGNDTQSTFNALNQVVRKLSRPVQLPSDNPTGAFRYEKLYWYDADNNLVRVDVENRDETGLRPATNTHFSTIYSYDILNHMTAMGQEKGAINLPLGVRSVEQLIGGLRNQFVITEYAYDANRNRRLVRYGEATNGHDPFNTVDTQYDERNLTFKTVRGMGDPIQSTTQYDYDGNGNKHAERQGLEYAPRVTLYGYDGYNRIVQMTDPMGNVTEHRYDANGNVGGDRFPGSPNPFGTRVSGELVDVPGGSANVRLSETTYTYDKMDRVTRQTAAFFDTQTQAPISDGNTTTSRTYTDESKVKTVTDDNSQTKTNFYDTASRTAKTVDAKGNERINTYDANSNVSTITSREKSDLGNPDQLFTTTVAYDGLDRPSSTTDNIGNVNRSLYDSRDNRTRTIDALTHQVLYQHDGLKRLVRTIRDMNGDGPNPAARPGDAGPDIVTEQTWDDASRLTSQTDDNSNPTTYVYDGLNRKVAERYADNTVKSFTFDVHDNMTFWTDPNQNQVTQIYDLDNRLTRRDIAVGPGVSDDTTFEVYKYDGLSRLVHAEDDDSLVTRQYDSLSHVTREVQNGQVVVEVYDGVGNQLSCTYPGGRIVSNTHDALNRKKVISDQDGMIATYYYVGPGRVERRDYGNNTRTEYSYDGITGVPNAGSDLGVKRITRTRHMVVGRTCNSDTDCPTGDTCEPPTHTCIIDDRIYTWDKMFNKTRRKDVRPNGPQLTHDYSYDSIYRLIHTHVTDGNGAPVRDTIYNLDGVGNRMTTAGSPDPGIYTMSAASPEPADRQMSQYTSTSFDVREYDRDGNLNGIDVALPSVRTIVYDYRNRRVRFTEPGTGTSSAYRYDTFRRRIERALGAPSANINRYFYTDATMCEEQDGASTIQATYIYGQHINDILTATQPETTLYYHADDLHNSFALTDSGQAILERYEYGDYGVPYVFDNDGRVLPHSTVSPAYLFTGQQFDEESESYFYRTRYHEPRVGRFASRDTIGVWGDDRALGNAFTYSASGPFTSLDPFGRDGGDNWWDNFWHNFMEWNNDPKVSEPLWNLGEAEVDLLCQWLGEEGEELPPAIATCKIWDKAKDLQEYADTVNELKRLKQYEQEHALPYGSTPEPCPLRELPRELGPDEPSPRSEYDPIQELTDGECKLVSGGFVCGGGRPPRPTCPVINGVHTCR
jgi:RHS repeat-associated protein